MYLPAATHPRAPDSITDIFPPAPHPPQNPENPLRFRTVMISDTHLGRAATNAEFLLEFLQRVECDKMFIVGDFIDGWNLKSHTKPFPEMHKRCIDALHHQNKVWVRGNHDEDIADPALGIMGKDVTFRDAWQRDASTFRIVENAVHTDKQGRRLKVEHGDTLDCFQTNGALKNFAEFVDHAYEPLLQLSNAFRKAAMNVTGRDISLVAPLKNFSKFVSGAVRSFDRAIAQEAANGTYDGHICGHIHRAKLEDDGKFVTANCGDWVETGTALVEDLNGEWRLIIWKDERAKLGLGKLPSVQDANPFQHRRGVTDTFVSFCENIWRPQMAPAQQPATYIPVRSVA